MEKTVQQKVNEMRAWKYSLASIAEQTGLATTTVQMISAGERGKNPRHTTVTAIDKLYAKLVKKHGGAK